MKRYLLLLLVLTLSFAATFAADESTITIKTSKPVGTSVSLDAYTSSKDEAFTVDWGDGEEKIYNIDPSSYGYFRRIKAEIHRDDVRFGPVNKPQTAAVAGLHDIGNSVKILYLSVFSSHSSAILFKIPEEACASSG